MTENKLIRVDDARRAIEHIDPAFVYCIDSVPTVDAVEVVHGYTVPAEQPKMVLLDKKCGICDSLMLSTDAYCPSCGAIMDGELSV